MTTESVQSTVQLPDIPSGIVKLSTVFLNIVPQVVKLTGILIAAGFFVVHSYLESFTHLFTYKISIVQYLAAGISLCLYLLFSAANYILSHIQIFLCAVLFSLLLGYITFRFSPNWVKIVPHIPLLRHAKRVFSVLSRLLWYFNWVFVVLTIILVALLYGPQHYATMPRSLGGGMPTNIKIIFKDDKSAVWPFTVTSGQSETVQFVMELSDGILVWDISQKVAIEIKNDAINGIVEVP